MYYQSRVLFIQFCFPEDAYLPGDVCSWTRWHVMTFRLKQPFNNSCNFCRFCTLGRVKRHGIIGIELEFPPLVGDVCSSMHLLDDAMTVIQGKIPTS